MTTYEKILIGTLSLTCIVMLTAAASVHQPTLYDGEPNLGISADEVAPPKELEGIIRRTAKEYGLDPAVVMAIIEHESDWCPLAVNPESGATGLMQIVPGTWDWLNDQLGGGLDPLNAEDNIRAGCYLLSLFSKYGLAKMVDCYAQGEGAALMGATVAPVTREILALIPKYQTKPEVTYTSYGFTGVTK